MQPRTSITPCESLPPSPRRDFCPEIWDQVFDHMDRPSFDEFKRLRAVSHDFAERMRKSQGALEDRIAQRLADDALGGGPVCCGGSRSTVTRSSSPEAPPQRSKMYRFLHPSRARREKEALARDREIAAQRRHKEEQLQKEQQARQAVAMPYLVNSVHRNRNLFLDIVAADDLRNQNPAQMVNLVQAAPSVERLAFQLHEDGEDGLAVALSDSWGMAPRYLRLTSKHGKLDVQMLFTATEDRFHVGPSFDFSLMQTSLFQNLVELRLEGISLPGASGSTLSPLPNLKKLYLDKNLMSHRELALFPWEMFASIETLHIVDNLLDRGRLCLFDLRPLVNLHHLDLRSNMLRLEDVAALGESFPSAVTSLNLNFNYLISSFHYAPSFMWPAREIYAQLFKGWPLRPTNERERSAVARHDAAKTRVSKMTLAERFQYWSGLQSLDLSYTDNSRTTGHVVELLKLPNLGDLKLKESLGNAANVEKILRVAVAHCRTWVNAEPALLLADCCRMIVHHVYKDSFWVEACFKRQMDATVPELRLSFYEDFFNADYCANLKTQWDGMLVDGSLPED